jgi:hypothetical protein
VDDQWLTFLAIVGGRPSVTVGLVPLLLEVGIASQLRGGLKTETGGVVALAPNSRN